MSVGTELCVNIHTFLAAFIYLLHKYCDCIHIAIFIFFFLFNSNR